MLVNFDTRQMDASSFFPIQVSFSSTKLLCDIAVLSVVSDDDSPVKHSTSSFVFTESYEIV